MFTSLDWSAVGGDAEMARTERRKMRRARGSSHRVLPDVTLLGRARITGRAAGGAVQRTVMDDGSGERVQRKAVVK